MTTSIKQTTSQAAQTTNKAQFAPQDNSVIASSFTPALISAKPANEKALTEVKPYALPYSGGELNAKMQIFERSSGLFGLFKESYVKCTMRGENGKDVVFETPVDKFPPNNDALKAIIRTAYKNGKLPAELYKSPAQVLATRKKTKASITPEKVNGFERNSLFSGVSIASGISNAFAGAGQWVADNNFLNQKQAGEWVAAKNPNFQKTQAAQGYNSKLATTQIGEGVGEALASGIVLTLGGEVVGAGAGASKIAQWGPKLVSTVASPLAQAGAKIGAKVTRPILAPMAKALKPVAKLFKKPAVQKIAAKTVKAAPKIALGGIKYGLPAADGVKLAYDIQAKNYKDIGRDIGFLPFTVVPILHSTSPATTPALKSKTISSSSKLPRKITRVKPSIARQIPLKNPIVRAIIAAPVFAPGATTRPITQQERLAEDHRKVVQAGDDQGRNRIYSKPEPHDDFVGGRAPELPSQAANTKLDALKTRFAEKIATKAKKEGISPDAALANMRKTDLAVVARELNLTKEQSYALLTTGMYRTVEDRTKIASLVRAIHEDASLRPKIIDIINDEYFIDLQHLQSKRAVQLIKNADILDFATKAKLTQEQTQALVKVADNYDFNGRERILEVLKAIRQDPSFESRILNILKNQRDLNELLLTRPIGKAVELFKNSDFETMARNIGLNDVDQKRFMVMCANANIRTLPQLWSLAKALHQDPYYKHHILEVLNSSIELIYRISPDKAIAFYKNQDLKYLGHSLNLTRSTQDVLAKAENGISADTRPIAVDLIKALHADPLLKGLIPSILKNTRFFTSFAIYNLPSFRRLSLEQSMHFVRDTGFAQIIKKLGLNQQKSDVLIQKALFTNPYAQEQAIKLLEKINVNPSLKPQMLDILNNGSFNGLLTMSAEKAYGFVESADLNKLSKILNLRKDQSKAVIAAGNRYDIVSSARIRLSKLLEALSENVELNVQIIKIVEDKPVLAKLLMMETEEAVAEVAALAKLDVGIANLRGSGIRDFDIDTMLEVWKDQTPEMKRRILEYTRAVAPVQRFIDGKNQLVFSPEATASLGDANMGKLQVAKMNANANSNLNGLDRFLKQYGF